MSFLEIADVTKRFAAVTAVDGISLSVAAGSRTAIVGPSGSGKTTLLRLIAGFEVPDIGSIRLGGEVLADQRTIVPAHLRGIGIVAQDGALFPHLSIADNIGFGLARGLPDRRQRIAELLDLVELGPELLARKPDELSGGQQQRVALARALAIQPRLMLLDEPFSALDTGLRMATRKAVASLLQAAGITAILVTHDQAEAMSFADQVAILDLGRLEQVGSPRDLYLRPRRPMVAELLGSAVILDADIAGGVAHCALGALPIDRGAIDRGAVDDGRFDGPGRIMLRPEQISFALAPNGTSAGVGAVSAQVLDVDFNGGVCRVRIALNGSSRGAGGRRDEVTLVSASFDAPDPGAIVALSVRGVAHVFEAA